MRWTLLVLAVGCATGLPVDARSDTSARWARVLTEPLERDAGHTTFVRHALARNESTRSVRAFPKRVLEARFMLRELLPLALERADDEGLRTLADWLQRREILGETSVRDALSMMWPEIDRLIASGLSASAYQTVLYRTGERPPARSELAFIALEATAVWLERSFEDLRKDGQATRSSSETDRLGPTSVPYLAVAAGAEPDEVRAVIAELLEAMPR